MSTNNKMKAVIFDLYGTLLYSSSKVRPYSTLFEDLHLSAEEIKTAKKIAMTENFDDFSVFANRIKPGTEINLQKYDDLFREESKLTTTYSDVMPVLTDLLNQDVKIGVISNLATHYKLPFFGLGLDEFVDECGFSCDEGILKPNPLIYESMLRKLGARSASTIMIGDSFRCDFLGPKSVGINAILLDRNGRHNSDKCGHKLQSLREITQYLC